MKQIKLTVSIETDKTDAEVHDIVWSALAEHKVTFDAPEGEHFELKSVHNLPHIQSLKRLSHIFPLSLNISILMYFPLMLLLPCDDALMAIQDTSTNFYYDFLLYAHSHNINMHFMHTKTLGFHPFLHTPRQSLKKFC